MTGVYHPSDEEVRYCMERWQTPHNHEAYARRWLRQCGSERFACGICFSIVWEGVKGVCLAVSSGSSTALSSTINNADYQHSMGGIWLSGCMSTPSFTRTRYSGTTRYSRMAWAAYCLLHVFDSLFIE